uniref:Uncharacterized protein n=1 Tax=Glossina austeni TaxID=7395 RepID=A0A1A9UE56_GLOAU
MSPERMWQSLMPQRLVHLIQLAPGNRQTVDYHKRPFDPHNRSRNQLIPVNRTFCQSVSFQYVLRYRPYTGRVGHARHIHIPFALSIIAPSKGKLIRAIIILKCFNASIPQQALLQKLPSGQPWIAIKEISMLPEVRLYT